MIDLKIANRDDLSNSIYFQNYERIDESVIFDAIIEKLSADSTVILGQTQELPYCLLKNCKLKDDSFDIILDDNYGAYIVSTSNEVLKKIITYFD